MTATWRHFDPSPPVAMLVTIAERFDGDLAIQTIIDVGKAGRLASYRPHLIRFLELRRQSHRLIREEAA